MRNKVSSLLWIIFLGSLIGITVWHTVSWHEGGTYDQMLKNLGASNGWITVLYNLCLMLWLGALLGVIMENLTDFFGFKMEKTKHFDDDVSHDS